MHLAFLGLLTAHTEPLSAFSNPHGAEWAPKDKPWHRALQINTGCPDLGCSTGRRDALRSKTSDHVLRAHFALGRVGTTSMPQPHCYPDTHPQCVTAGGLLPGTTHMQSSEDRAGARSALHTGAGDQQVHAKRSRVQRSEAVPPHPAAPVLAPPSVTGPRRKHAPVSACLFPSGLPRS